MDLFNVTGKTVLITGGTSGIGYACAQSFASAGAHVAISGPTEEECRRAKTGLETDGLEVATITCDLRWPASVSALLGTFHDRFGQLDVLVSNAGMEGPLNPLDTDKLDALETLLSVNLTSAILLSSMTAKTMARSGGGSIILTASIAGLRGNRMIGAYGVTKAGLIQQARNLAVEWGPANVRANTISPGLIETPFSQRLMSDTAFMEKRMQMTPLRRAGQPHEIAAAALFLASPGGAFITGQNIVVDGGTAITDGS